MRGFGWAVLTFMVMMSSSVGATTHCVSSADELNTTLALAQSDVDDPDIRIRTGLYLAPDSGWTIDIHENRGITISGGYLDAGCQTISLDASLTVLDGQDKARPLTIDTTFAEPFSGGKTITVSGLTFQNGLGDTVGGLKVSDAGPIYTGHILIERNIFRHNVASTVSEENSAGGLLAATDGDTFDGSTFLIVRDNLFDGNVALDASALQMYSNNSISITNNTFVGNRFTDASLPHRAVATGFTASNANYSNNIFWNNDPDNFLATFDIRVDDANFRRPGTVLVNNNVGSIDGATLTEAGTTNIDPAFVDEAGGDFRLTRTSNLLDSGVDAPNDGAGDADVKGSMRLQGLHIDRGAYESIAGIVFADDFEGHPR